MAWLLTGWWLAECGSCARGIDHLACVKISDAMHSMLLLLLLRGLHYVSFGSAFFFLEAEENQSNSGRRLHVCNWAKNDLCSFDFPFKIIRIGDLSETFLGYSGIAAFRSFCCVVHPLMLSNDVV